MLASGLVLRLRAYRFRFKAIESVYFPPGKAGNVIRGALEIDQKDGVADGRSLPYALPAGFSDPPGPFVLRAAHLDGKTFSPNDEFHIDLHVFDVSPSLIDTLHRTMEIWARTGLGPRRGLVEFLGSAHDVIEIPLAKGSPISKCSLRFRTPTDLKGNPSRSEIPFGILFARIRDRVSTLSSLYGEGPPALDFRALGERANAVRIVRSNLRWSGVSRRSSRTGAVHSIGGLTGLADYEGELTEFHPWLRAAWWTGVGRHTVWGNGAVEIVHAE